MLDIDYLKRVAHYFESGDCQFEFEHGEEERRLAIIDFLEHLMELGEQADELATKLIFKDAYASMTNEDGVAKALEEEAAGEPGD
ncbi:hypothetical protein GM415_03665 [Pseudodesulfovibrio cashew]|uniref:Uncharacterized protein n=1 Tax=Pseudodesulfovibrio cashew TaxID=2678688 RepID=A0A6I6J8U4_9BACT|nr:hypothetical protein [Pseudodesulfovibrio cashew]QGY39256.1 hypothetical protein GM415_03665 [Pseudodesulfovibrio cashew]